MQRFVLAMLALGCIAPGASEAQALREAFEAAWARQPGALTAAARDDLFDARRSAADALFPAAPSIGFGQRTDHIDRNRGAREFEGEIALPLWTPGARARGMEWVEADRNRYRALAEQAKWRIAGEVREIYWHARLAQTEHAIAARKLTEAQALAADVARRVQAGDLAQVDANQTEASTKVAAGALIEAGIRMDRAKQQFRLLTGLAALPIDEEVLPSVVPLAEAHPQFLAGARAIDAARAKLAQATTVTRDAPELALGVRSERNAAGERFDHSLRLGIRIPFGSDARNRPRIAEANVELLEASAELELVRRQLAAETEAARAALDASRAIEALAAERFALARSNQALYERAFKLGGLDLPTRLRAENERFDAELALARARTEAARAISRLNQSYGLLP